jgi:hypothetical protein
MVACELLVAFDDVAAADNGFNVGGSGAEGHDGDRVYGDNVTPLISRSFDMVGWLAFSRSK